MPYPNTSSKTIWQKADLFCMSCDSVVKFLTPRRKIPNVCYLCGSDDISFSSIEDNLPLEERTLETVLEVS